MNNYLIEALNPAIFAESVGIVPDDWQRAMLMTSKRRVILNWCRQSGKSTTTAVAGEHRAVFFPGSLVLIVSPSLKQSQEIFLKLTGIRRLESSPQELIEDTKTSCIYKNGSRVLCLPGSETSIRGYSAPDLIIVDEASRVPAEVLSALRPMMATRPDAKLIMLSTPNGRDNDFARIWHSKDEDWLRIQVTASECPRISRSFLRSEEVDLPGHVYRREYECCFDSPEGSLFRQDDLYNAIDDTLLPLFGKNTHIDNGLKALEF